MLLTSIVWALVALCFIAAGWDTAYRFFAHRRKTDLEERVVKLEADVQRALQQSQEAETYARGLANRAQGAPTRWGRQ